MKNNYKKDIHLEGIKVFTTFCGIKNTPDNEDDLLLVEFDKSCSIAGVFTKSLTSSAPVNLCKSNLSSAEQATVRAIVVNSGNANAFTGKLGEESVLKISKYLSKKLNSNINEIYTASTGVIGEQLDTNKIINGLKSITSCETQSWFQAAHAIKTTDTFPKVVMRTCKIDGIEIDIVGITKGSGMIAPDMATMLGFIFTNANLHSDILQRLLAKANETSFNSITVDSDTSTSDTVLLSATRRANHNLITKYSDRRLKEFKITLSSLMLELAKLIIKDGEGASKFIKIDVLKCKSEEDAKKIAFSIANSALVKAAVAGEDPNWGRIMMAVGKNDVDLNVNSINLMFGENKVFEKGQVAKNYSEHNLKEYMKNDNINIIVDLNLGKKNFTCYTMDFTKKYLEINSDYRS
mgnify:CR=1 FL=1